MRTSVEHSAQLLIRGKNVAIPTETVWGLAASIHQPEAIHNIFSLKGRPRENPLIIHLADIEQLHPYVEAFPNDFEKLAGLWPGPLTLVLKVHTDLIPEEVRAGLPTAAFRIPAHPETRRLLKLTGPLVIPSANISGRPSSTQGQHVEEDFGLDFPVMVGETSSYGVESTILAFGEGRWRILRQGALSAEYFESYLNYIPKIVKLHSSEKPESPGQLFKHYSPKAKLVLSGTAEAVLGFEERNYALPNLKLGSILSAESALYNLYDKLREIDRMGLQVVLLDMQFPTTGLWSTLRERLQKASAQ